MAVNEDSAGLASSLTDLMTSLAVIFILLLVASHNNEQEKLDAAREKVAETQHQLDAAEEKTRATRHEMLVALQKALEEFRARGVSAEADPKDPLGLLVLVPEGLLAFAFGEAKIPQGGLEFLRSFARKLAETACSDTFKDEINSIVVEGHTDSRGTDEINLPLSQARSMAVVLESLRILSGATEYGKPSSGLRSCFLNLLSATGRGSSEPILTEGKEDEPRSRRVVFKIRVRSLEQRQLPEALQVATPTQPASTP